MQTNLHDFQLGVYQTYRNFPKIDKKEDSILLTYNSLNEPNKTEQLQLCFSSNSNTLCKKRNYVEEVKNSELRTETVYDLEKIFDRKNYKDGKAFSKKVTRWLNYFNAHEYFLQKLYANNLQEVNKLFDDWIKEKQLEKAMIVRYQNCITVSVNNQDNCEAIGFYNKDKQLLGARFIYCRDDDWAFDLVGFVTRKDYTMLGEVFRIATLKYIKDSLNKRYFNLGLNDGESLTQHKHSLPHEDLKYWVIR